MKKEKPIVVYGAIASNFVVAALDVQFKPDLSSPKLMEVIDELESNIRNEHKSVKQLFIETERLKNGKRNRITPEEARIESNG